MKYIFLLLLLFTVSLQAKDYREYKNVIEFIDMMSTKYNFKRTYLEKLFKDVQIQATPLKIYSPAPKDKEVLKRRAKLYPKYGAWDRYIKHKITPKRIEQGKRFINKYRTTFKKVEQKYGVPSEYIAAIIGIESVYGKNVGKFPVFDTLSTLAFEKNRRNKFFKKQLEEFILLSFRYNINPKNVNGSYAGAIGLGQFIPSSYRHFGVDFNKDGKVSLQDPQDAIASIANYLKKHNWRKNEEVATRVSYEGNRFTKYKTGYNRKYNRKDLKGIRPKYGKWNYFDKVRLIKLSRKDYDELWYAAKNFYVITRYNHSAYYAMAVHQLAQKIKN